MLVTSYRPLLNPLPLSLAHLTHGQPSADAKAGHELNDKTLSMHNGTPDKDVEDAMWNPSGKERPSLVPRKSAASMRSWRSSRLNSPPFRAADKPTPTSSPAPQSLAPPPQEPVAMKPEDVEMSNLGAARQSVVAGPTAVAPSPTSDGALTDDATDDQHSQAPVIPRGRRRSSTGGRKRAVSAGPWEDHRHARQRPAPHWELRRTSTIQSLTESNQEDIGRYFARPGGPGVIRPPDDSAAPAAFFHPATHQPQPIVWLPVDELGVARDQVRKNRKEGVKSTTRNAVFDSKNRVQVKGPAPDDK